MEKVKCNICGYAWFKRRKNPIACPKCKRYDWNKENINTDVRRLDNKDGK